TSPTSMCTTVSSTAASPTTSNNLCRCAKARRRGGPLYSTGIWIASSSGPAILPAVLQEELNGTAESTESTKSTEPAQPRSGQAPGAGRTRPQRRRSQSTKRSGPERSGPQRPEPQRPDAGQQQEPRQAAAIIFAGPVSPHSWCCVAQVSFFSRAQRWLLRAVFR